jgi:hypothetical protein
MLLGLSRSILFNHFCFLYLDHVISMMSIVIVTLEKVPVRAHQLRVRRLHEVTDEGSFGSSATDRNLLSETTHLGYGTPGSRRPTESCWWLYHTLPLPNTGYTIA